MVNLFGGRLKKSKQLSLIAEINGQGKPPEGVKQQISLVVQRLDAQTSTLEMASKRFESRGADIFNRVVKALSDRDEARAHILATELSEIRKVQKMLTQASLALQSVSMRLNTVSEFGDVVAALGPAKSALSSIGSDMCGIFPQASEELGNIGNLLSDIVSSTRQTSDLHSCNCGIQPEAESILIEAERAAEKKLEQQLPEAAKENPIRKLAGIDT